MSERLSQTLMGAKVRSFKFGIRNIFWLTFFVAMLTALVARGGSWAVNILLVVLLANFAGVVIALIVTFVFRLPVDGIHESDDPPESPVCSNVPE